MLRISIPSAILSGIFIQTGNFF